MMRSYEDGEQDEVNRRFDEGGILWFIKRVDTNQYYFKPFQIRHSSQHIEPGMNTGWTDTIDFHTLNGAFLTKESALENSNFTQGGCIHCGNGAEKIIVEVEEHEFIPPKN